MRRTRKTTRPADNRPIEEQLADALHAELGVRPETEYRFTELRRWRMDVAYPKQKVAVEIHGRQHGRARQARNDAEKHNCATELGWTCLFFPASSVLTKKRLPRIVAQISRVLHDVSDEDAACFVLTGE